MHYHFESLDQLLIFKLHGEMNHARWQLAFAEAERVYASGDYQQMMIDGEALTAFDISHAECQRLAQGFVRFAAKAAFYSSDPLAFGMMRVIHSYSDNEAFRVFKNADQAMEYLVDSERPLFCSVS